MEHERWQIAKELFRLALEQPAGEREAFVKRQTRDDPIQSEVLRLLRHHEQNSDFLISPMSPEPQSANDATDPLISRNLGGFVLLKRIGMGGMGAVYEAEQSQPRRRAAVKVLRPGVFAGRMRRRFEFESEVLAKLRHPGIAQVYAAGVFEMGGEGQPWFAMELIDGPGIQTYAKQNALTIADKVRLLLAVCDAVQHAHQCGVIHRDLKPDNILITTSGAGGAVQPKILDFGVARSIDTQMHATMHTVAGELVGTLAYMSPEQLLGDSEQIDARCDVFALGVIAYELLGNKLPHGAAGASFAHVMRAIEQDEPPMLGTIDPALRGDMELIIAKALEKDPGRRYQSAAELAADLRRYLNDEPVLARPATAIYQFRKFARRNRALVGGVFTTMLALAVGMILYAREAQSARRAADEARYEADKATAINNFITNDFLMKLLAAANAPETERRLPVADLVNQAASQVGVMFADQPLAEAAVRNEIGSIYYNLDAVDQSGEQFERALTLWESQLGPNHVDTLKAVNNLGQVRARQRRGQEAEALYRRALEGRRRALGEDNSYTLITKNNLAEIFRGADRLDEAEALLRETLASQERVHGPSHKNTITTLGNLGALLMQRGRNEEAETLHRRAYAASRATLGRDHVMTIMTGVRLGSVLHRLKRATDAEPLLVEVVTASEQALGDTHSETINARRMLARSYRSKREYDAATTQLQKALAGARSRTPPSRRTAQALQQELDALAAEKSVSHSATSNPVSTRSKD